MSWLPSGTVYGALLNQRSEYEALAPHMHDAPYKAPPKAPVLYVKTANTFNPDGGTIALPARVAEIEVGATVGLVMGAQGRVRGCVLLNDVSIPHASVYRPPVKFKCLDGFLGVGTEVREVDPASVQVEVHVNGELRETVRFDDLVRDPAQLLAEVGEFMTLGEGDVLMLGCDASRPRARVGDRIELRSAALGTVSHTLVGEAA